MKANFAGRMLRRVMLVMLVGSGANCVANEPEEGEGHAAGRDLVAKLELVKLKSQPYRLELSSESAGTYVIKYQDVYTGKRRHLGTAYIPAGEGPESVFFSEPPVRGMFRLAKVERRPQKLAHLGIVHQESVATIEVLRGVKKGTKHEIHRSNKKHIIRSYKAILVLKATGKEAHEFVVEDGETFSLPYDAAAVAKPYKFKGLNEDGAVVIEWEVDGKVETRVLTP